MTISKHPTALSPAALVIASLLFPLPTHPGGAASQNKPPALQQDYPVKPVPFTDVKLSDTFWAPRLETNRTVSVPYALKMNEETGRVDNFRKAAHLVAGPYKGKRYNDSDVYKAMEGAAYTLLLHADAGLEKTLDDLVALIGKAQEPDGYLYTTRTADPNTEATSKLLVLGGVDCGDRPGAQIQPGNLTCISICHRSSWVLPFQPSLPFDFSTSATFFNPRISSVFDLGQPLAVFHPSNSKNLVFHSSNFGLLKTLPMLAE